MAIWLDVTLARRLAEAAAADGTVVDRLETRGDGAECWVEIARLGPDETVLIDHDGAPGDRYRVASFVQVNGSLSLLSPFVEAHA